MIKLATLSNQSVDNVVAVLQNKKIHNYRKNQNAIKLY